MTDTELIDDIESIRSENNSYWMDLLRLAMLHAPDETREILRKIQRLDGEVRRLTQELAQ